MAQALDNAPLSSKCWSEDELALAFVNQNPGWRWVEASGCWFFWTGTHWQRDATRAAFDAVRRTLRLLGLNDRKTGAAATVAAVEKLAKTDRAVAAMPEQFDSDPWLLNTPGGTVDLRTGTMHDHRSEDYMTRLTAVTPGGECPNWMNFLEEVTAGDRELVGFLQRLTGYALTGSTREHCLFFMFGAGRNGKGVFQGAIRGLLGDYAAVAPADTFTESRNERHPTELAALQGARLVIASETEEGRRWNEARIKALTGGDPISARFMRRDFFTFVPQFKLLIAGNHRPRLRAVDAAMRARLHMIPFIVPIPAERRDPDLPEKLREEWPGILAWAIAGCLDYLDGGLRPPECVRQATAGYFEGQDLFSDWLTEHCEIGRDFWESPSTLFRSWCAFTKSANERPGQRSEFRDRLQAHGFCEGRDARGRFWQGLKLKPNSAPDSWL